MTVRSSFLYTRQTRKIHRVLGWNSVANSLSSFKNELLRGSIQHLANIGSPFPRCHFDASLASSVEIRGRDHFRRKDAESDAGVDASMSLAIGQNLANEKAARHRRPEEHVDSQTTQLVQRPGNRHISGW